MACLEFYAKPSCCIIAIWSPLLPAFDHFAVSNAIENQTVARMRRPVAAHRWCVSIMAAGLRGRRHAGLATSRSQIISLDPSGQMANFSTLIGGAGHDTGGPVGADASGNVVIALQGASDTLPTAADAYDRLCGVHTPCAPIQPDVYVAKFSPLGAILTATYIGGSGVDYPRHLSVLPDGSIVVGGSTQSADFPRVRALPTQVVPAINTETGFVSFFDTNL